MDHRAAPQWRSNQSGSSVAPRPAPTANLSGALIFNNSETRVLNLRSEYRPFSFGFKCSMQSELSFLRVRFRRALADSVWGLTSIYYILFGYADTLVCFVAEKGSMAKSARKSAPMRTLTEKAYQCIKEGIVRGEIEEGVF